VTTSLEFADGTSEHVDVVDDVFGVAHLPAAEPVGGLVVCSPLYSEFLKNNRREVLLSRALASAGYAVQRFHYRGTGNSHGTENAIAFETMTDDARSAANRLRARAGVESPAVLGTRLSALVAAAVVDAEAPLLLWDPVESGRRYFRDLLRAWMIVGISDQNQRTTAQLETEFAEMGRLDVMGFAIPRGLRDDVTDRALDATPGSGPTLVVQLASTDEIGAATAKVATRLEATGRPVDIRCVPRQEAWWFHQDVDKLVPDEGAGLDEAVLDATLAWIVERGATIDA
jgi:alpha/beta superfamily hydrolase